MSQTANEIMTTSLINNKFRITRRIGGGSFGEIYMGVGPANEKVAIKFEKHGTRCPQLRHEYKVYRELASCHGFCRVYHFGTQDSYNVMVMDLLGPSLEDLFNKCNRRFSLKTVLQMADQLLERVDTLHARHLIHRDIKPANFVIGLAEQGPTVFCVDFGLSKRYRHPKTLQHIPHRDGRSLTGTPRYASINNHLGIEQARRDDLESIGYVLVYFLKGTLPWQGLKAKNAQRKYRLILEKKQQISIAQLCQGCPNQFAEFLGYGQQRQGVPGGSGSGIGMAPGMGMGPPPGQYTPPTYQQYPPIPGSGSGIGMGGPPPPAGTRDQQYTPPPPSSNYPHPPQYGQDQSSQSQQQRPQGDIYQQYPSSSEFNPPPPLPQQQQPGPSMGEYGGSGANQYGGGPPPLPSLSQSQSQGGMGGSMFDQQQQQQQYQMPPPPPPPEMMIPADPQVFVVEDSVIMVLRPREFYRKKQELSMAGAGALQVFTPFEDTLTRFQILSPSGDSTGERSLNTAELLEASQALPPHVCTLHVVIAREGGLHIANVPAIARDSLVRCPLREGVRECLQGLAFRGVPVYVFSSGFGDLVAQLLIQGGTMEGGAITPNVRIISNFFRTTPDGTVRAFSQPVVHDRNMNASTASSHMGMPVPDRPYALVLGSEEHHTHCTHGAAVKEQLSIGFLRLTEDLPKKLPAFLATYDAVVLGDGSLKFVQSVIDDVIQGP
eukprot:gene8380-17283_t